MAIDLGLTGQEMRWFLNALTASSVIRIRADLWDRSRKHTSTIRSIQDGQVNINTQGNQSSRSCTMTVYDEDDHLKLDTNLLFLDRMLSVDWEILVPEMARYVSVRIFWGPVNKAIDHGQGIIEIQAQGKELWARTAVRVSRQWPKGARTTDVIRTIMHMVGETNHWLDIPDLPHRLTSAFAIAPKNPSAWKGALYLATSIDANLFYDGGSVCKLRPTNTNLVYTFDQHWAINPPTKSTLVGGNDLPDDLASGIRNHFFVEGRKKPHQPPIMGEWQPPAGNRFAIDSLGNPGAGWDLRDTLQSDHVATVALANRIASNRGHRALQVAESVGVTGPVVPHLDPYDFCRWHLDSDGGGFEFLQASIPFLFRQDNPMTVGFLKRVSVPPQGHLR